MKAEMRSTILFMILLPFLLPAQPPTKISGYVTDASSQKPIPDVEIMVRDHTLGTISGSDGSFSLELETGGDYILVFKHISYYNEEKSVNVETGRTKRIFIAMVPGVRTLEEAVISVPGEQREREGLHHIPSSGITKLEIERRSPSDPGEMLRSVPNVSGIRKGVIGIDPVVRGFRFSQLNIRLNHGQKIEGGCPNRMDPVTAHIEMEDVENIEVLKGPHALKYGPSAGGVVNIITSGPTFTEKPGIKMEALKGFETNWNGTVERIRISASNKKLFAGISANHRAFGDYRTGNGEITEAGYTKYSLKGTFGYRPAPYQRYSITYENSLGRHVDYPALPMDERKDDTELLSVDGVIGNFIGGSTLRVKLYNSDVRHEMDNKQRPFSDTVVAISTIHAVNRGFRLAGEAPIRQGNITTGIDYEKITKDGTRVKNMIMQPGLPVKEEKIWNNASLSNLGIFSEFHRNAGKTKLTFAARVDVNSATSGDIRVMHPSAGEIYNYANDSTGSDFVNFSLSGGISHTLNENFTLSVALGRGVRSPDLTERFIILLPIGYDNFDYLGNPGLKPEVNHQADLTIGYISERIGKAELTGFFSLVGDYISGKPVPPSVQKPLSKDVAGVKIFWNSGEAFIRGIEFSFVSPHQYRLTASLNAAFTYGTLSETEKFIFNEGGEVTDSEAITNDAIAEIPPFESSMGVEYRMFSNRLIPRLTLRAVAPQKHISESQYEKASPGFFVAGFSCLWNINRMLSLSGGVHNIFDAAYYEHLNRNIVGTDNPLYEPGRRFYIHLRFAI